MRSKLIVKSIVIFGVLAAILFGAGKVSAAGFKISPAKIEVIAEAGQLVIKNVIVKNETAEKLNFKVEVKDIEGSRSAEQPSRILEQSPGLYSLKDFLKPAAEEFTLEPGEEKNLLVEISLPETIEPGGRYGAVLFSSMPLDSGEAPVVVQARAGALFFVRVEGEAEEAGKLEAFQIEPRKFYQTEPVYFSILYKNEGNVHLNPYGIVEIKDVLGRKADEITVEPYFALPGSLRERKIDWQNLKGPCRYTATLHLNRGYGDIIDTAEVSFWVIPWWAIAAGGGAIALLIMLLIGLILHRRG